MHSGASKRAHITIGTPIDARVTIFLHFWGLGGDAARGRRRGQRWALLKPGRGVLRIAYAELAAVICGAGRYPDTARAPQALHRAIAADLTAPAVEHECYEPQ